MFIKLGERRINLSKLSAYYPLDKKNRYTVVLEHHKNETEEIHFFENKDERDAFIAELDSMANV